MIYFRVCALAVLTGAIVLPLGTTLIAQEVNYVHWNWPVAFPKTASKEQQQLATELAKALERQTLAQNSSPGCCLWMEVLNWKPNPGNDGYIVFIQGGGGWIQATNTQQLRLAIDRVKQARLKTQIGVSLPEGILTNYPVVERNVALNR